LSLKRSLIPEESRSSSRRTKFEIWAAILESCLRESRTQSWLLRKLGLKTSAVKQAIEFLVKAHLIDPIQESSEDRTSYSTSTKGKEALEQYYTLITSYFIKS
jgi:predicted transcriptional regulator